MEVHHHAHTRREKWSHYFWEFFMLFLAVFFGMLAEYQLEHIIEHQREKKYIRSLIKDLEMDIGSLQNSYDNRVIQIAYLDSLHDLISTDYRNRMRDVYFYTRHINRHINFQYHDRTIQQLKNSGNLRLIRKQDAADSITVYDNERMRTSLVQLEGEIESRRHISFNLIGKIFDSYVWKQMTDTAGTIIRPPGNPVFVTNDKALLNEFAYRVITLRGTLFFTNRSIRTTISSAAKLIEVLKKEYNIE
ncbi:MAG TPA: hypothetical protein VF144_10835 [Chitinophagaceae bacterium]